MKKAIITGILALTQRIVDFLVHRTLRADAEEEAYGEQGADDYIFKWNIFHKLQSLETVNNVNRKARLNIFDSFILHFLLALFFCRNNFRHSCKALG